MSECEKTENWCEVRLKCYRELGWALFHLNYLEKHPCNGSQAQRVGELCHEGAANRDVASLEYWAHFLKRIEDETENLC